MNTRSILLALSTFLVCAGPSLAQAGAGRFATRVDYRQGRIYLPDRTRYEVRNLVVEGGRLSFRNLTDADVTELSLDEVDLVRAATGNRALHYGLIAGAAGALSAGVGAVANEEIDSPAAWAAGFGAAGLLVGFLIGRGSVTWSDIYVNPGPTGSLSLSPRVLVDRGQLLAGISIALPRN